MMRFKSATFCAAFGVVLCATCSAATLAPGALLYPMPGEAGPTGGVVLATTSLPFVTPNYSGSLTTTVISGDTTNPFPGGLTFTYVISNGPGTHAINRMSVNGYDGFLIDASYQTPTPAMTIPPAYVDRETNGSSLGFSFVAAPIGSGPITPNASSATMVLQTNATTFVPTTASVLDGLPATVGSFAPVPEPSTIVLAGTALALCIYRRSRRSQVRRPRGIAGHH
jgi:PEP-CTERM motif